MNNSNIISKNKLKQLSKNHSFLLTVFSFMSLLFGYLSFEKQNYNSQATTETYEGKENRNIEPILSHNPVLTFLNMKMENCTMHTGL